MPGHVLARLDDLASLDVAPALREAGHAPAGSRPGAVGGLPQTRESVPLTSLRRNASGVVAGVRIAHAAGASDPTLERTALRLIEIGFVQGAKLRVIAFGQPGDDPIGVRVGGRGGVSTFALRRQEAACVWVWVDGQ